MSDFTTRDGCFEAFLEQKKRAEKAERELIEARKPRRIALIGGVGSVIANALQDASRTAPEPVERKSVPNMILDEIPEAASNG